MERYIKTDVLVVGGGMAGMFAAIKAREQGMDVTLTDKAYIGKAGSTHFSEGDILYFRPERGHKLKEWLDLLSFRSEYVNNREWDEICLKEAEDRFNDLISWGVQFYQKDGDIQIFYMMGRKSVYEDVTMVNRRYAPTLRKKALEVGVRVLDNIMVSELVKQDGRIAGAVGFHGISGALHVFEAGAVIIATGSTSLKAGTYPVHFWTGDGEAMAYRAGAEVVSKEFMYGGPSQRAAVRQREKEGNKTISTDEVVSTLYQHPFAIGGGYTGWFNMPSMNAEGGPTITPAWEAHSGRAPLYFDPSWRGTTMKWMQEYFKRIELAWVQSEKIGLDVFQGGKIEWPASRVMTNSIFAGSGVWPVDKKCATAIPGLYAAGNSCGSMASGAIYASGGFGSNHAMVTGTRAGIAAAGYSSKMKKESLDTNELEKVKNIVCAPLERKGGFSPGWVTQIIQSISVPYFYLWVKHEDRLKPAISIAGFINNHLVPKLMAKDPHEWRLAHETRNLALTVEMRLRASLFRTESRGNHFREDFPRRDDPNWLAWVKIKESSGNMELYKEQIPQEWWPDISKPYEERYPTMLPLEEL